MNIYTLPPQIKMREKIKMILSTTNNNNNCATESVILMYSASFHIPTLMCYLFRLCFFFFFFFIIIVIFIIFYTLCAIGRHLICKACVWIYFAMCALRNCNQFNLTNTNAKLQIIMNVYTL